jgi:hypothetical protein
MAIPVEVVNGTIQGIQQNTNLTNLSISIVTAIILGIGLWFNWKQIKETKEALIEQQKVNYVQLLNDLDKDLTERMEKLNQAETVRGAIASATDILNALDRMAHLYHKKTIEIDTMNFFREMFAYGLSLEDWFLEKQIMTQDEIDAGWADFNYWCGREGIKPLPKNELPDQLLKFTEHSS